MATPTEGLFGLPNIEVASETDLGPRRMEYVLAVNGEVVAIRSECANPAGEPPERIAESVLRRFANVLGDLADDWIEDAALMAAADEAEAESAGKPLTPWEEAKKELIPENAE